MNDKHELLRLPDRSDTSIVTTGVSSVLVSRGRKEASNLLAERRQPTYLARVRIDRRYGLIDKLGKYVVDPVCGDILEFSSGLAAFSDLPTERRVFEKPIETLFNADLGLWGYFDKTGTVAIKPNFERARSFGEGLAGAAVAGKWGFIQRDGEFAIKPVFEGVSDFKEGLAAIRFKDRCGFINQSGEVCIEPRFDIVQGFSEGLAGAQLHGKYGFIDEKGAFVIPPSFDSISEFRFGLASVEMDKRDHLIDRQGNIIFRCLNGGDSIGAFSNGIARVAEQGEYWDHGYFIDARGNLLLDEDTEYSETLDAADYFSEGIGTVGESVAYFDSGRFALRRYADRQGSTRVYGYIDTRGKMVIEPQFHSASPFSNGMAVVDPTGESRYCFIDTSGTIAINGVFAAANGFINGLEPVRNLT